MFDEIEHLRDNSKLFQLLSYYVQAAEMNPEIFQDRLMVLEGVESKEMARMHGQLLAQNWIEPNSIAVPVVEGGTVPYCYRATRAGVRVFRQLSIEGYAAELDRQAA